MFAGTIEGMWRYPLKGLRGETMRSAVVDSDGMAGDRRLGVFEPGTGKAIWGGGHPKLMGWEAAYPAECGDSGGDGGDPVLYAPGGAAWAVDDAGLPAALAESIEAANGAELRQVRRDYGRMLVVFESSMRRLVELAGRPVEVERFRPNVLVSADLDPFVERDLAPGTPIRLGGHGFTVQEPCERCVLPSWDPFGGAERDMDLHRLIIAELGNHFGIYVRTGASATIAVGDAVAGHPRALSRGSVGSGRMTSLIRRCER